MILLVDFVLPSRFLRWCRKRRGTPVGMPNQEKQLSPDVDPGVKGAGVVLSSLLRYFIASLGLLYQGISFFSPFFLLLDSF